MLTEGEQQLADITSEWIKTCPTWVPSDGKSKKDWQPTEAELSSLNGFISRRIVELKMKGN